MTMNTNTSTCKYCGKSYRNLMNHLIAKHQADIRKEQDGKAK